MTRRLGLRQLTAGGLVMLLAGVGLLLGLAAPASGASASRSALPVVRYQSATVRAGGAAAAVTLTVACPGQTVDTLEIGVWQPGPKGHVAGAGGYAILPRPCTSTPQLVHAAVEVGNTSGEDTSWPGDGSLLRPGAARGGAFFYCSSTGCPGHSYPDQPLVLNDGPVLDQPSTWYGSLDPVATLVAGGAALDINWSLNCHNGKPVAYAQRPTLTQVIRPVWYLGFRIYTQTASPSQAEEFTKQCDGPFVRYRTRLYPDQFAFRPLHAGVAWIDAGFMWGQITIH